MTDEAVPDVSLQPGPAFLLQPDGSWDVSNVPAGVAALAEFSGYLTINGYRCTVFQTPEGDQWAQKSVATADAEDEEKMSTVSSKVAAEWLRLASQGVSISSVKQLPPDEPDAVVFEVEGTIDGHPFKVTFADSPVENSWDVVSGSVPGGREDEVHEELIGTPEWVAAEKNLASGPGPSSIASKVAAEWLRRQAKAQDLVSQVGEILNGESGQSGGTDGEFDEAIVEYCEEVRKVLPKMQSIFDKAFHDLVDFKSEVPEAKHPRVRQIGQEQVSKAVNEAATRIELLSFSLSKELETLLAGLESGARAKD